MCVCRAARSCSCTTLGIKTSNSQHLVVTWWQWLAKTIPTNIHLHLLGEREFEHCIVWQEAYMTVEAMNLQETVFVDFGAVFCDKGLPDPVYNWETPLHKNADIS